MVFYRDRDLLVPSSGKGAPARSASQAQLDVFHIFLLRNDEGRTERSLGRPSCEGVRVSASSWARASRADRAASIHCSRSASRYARRTSDIESSRWQFVAFGIHMLSGNEESPWANVQTTKAAWVSRGGLVSAHTERLDDRLMLLLREGGQTIHKNSGIFDGFTATDHAPTRGSCRLLQVTWLIAMKRHW